MQRRQLLQSLGGLVTTATLRSIHAGTGPSQGLFHSLRHVGLSRRTDSEHLEKTEREEKSLRLIPCLNNFEFAHLSPFPVLVSPFSILLSDFVPNSWCYILGQEVNSDGGRSIKGS